MRQIHSTSYTNSHHLMALHDLLNEAQTHLKLPLVYCPHCETIQEKVGAVCPSCQHHVKDLPNDRMMAEAFLETELSDVMLFDCRWINQQTQLHLMILNGRDI